MFPLLLMVFLLVPIVELYVIVQVAQGLGVFETIGLLIVISVVGAWLVKREGVGVLSRIQTRLAQGSMPTNEVIDGALIMFAGALMLTPGFVTDLLALVLLFPPTRALVRPIIRRRFGGRVTVFGGGFPNRPNEQRWRHGYVDVNEAPDDSPPDLGNPGQLDR